jgi:lipoprotein-anchoring transpeptidase ErfK/SrfK
MTLRRAYALCCVLLALSAVTVARAQAAALYFPATGHHLTDEHGFLSFWRAHDGERLLGYPVTEPLTVDQQPVQFFERGRLEVVADAAGAARVQTGQVGAEYAAALWKRFAPAGKPAAGVRVFEQTGHTLREPFLAFWEANGGQAFFGAPISEPLWERTESGQRRVQYFERARLERNDALAGTPGEISVGSLGRDLALLRGLDTAPVANRGAETYGPPAPQDPRVASLDLPPTATPGPTALPQTAAPAKPKPAAKPQPTPKAGPAAKPQPAPDGSGKVIVVNLSRQWLYAYEDGKRVYAAPVSTGRDGMNTPAGSYSIYSKLKLQTMRGVTNGQEWVVPDVPNVMYINGGVALHGTYWHNKFGTGARLSHGCVNLPLGDAAWLYNWAPMGTPVKVTY